MNFNSLQDYLDWRTEWRANYKTLSHLIRTMKNEIRAIMKKGDYAGQLQCSLVYKKAAATAMIEERKASKESVRESWAAWRTAKVTSELPPGRIYAAAAD